ncbi:hexokinase [Coemansia javaensis]|uniref:Phosphotransferase n=1 Tax=Coemansia javaensis TaxID=2761396 RepID=A0A9W8HJG7_9FUNG|nr:hexokinase [Coemansia javaensis]
MAPATTSSSSSSTISSPLQAGADQLLAAELRSIAESFAIPDEQLAKISGRMEAEMFRSLARGAGSELHMAASAVRACSGPDNGVALGMAIEASGRRIRIGSVRFAAGAIAGSHTHVFPAPAAATQRELFDFAASCLREFIQAEGLEGSGQPLPLGVTVALPVDSGAAADDACSAAKEEPALLRGCDVAQRMRDAVLRSHLPVRVASVTNNVVSALAAARFHDGTARVAAALNRGINAAYFEDAAQISSSSSSGSGPEDAAGDVAVNTEIGCFGSATNALPLTMWDHRVDRESRAPHTRCLEKLVAGQYLGEIVRNLVTDLVDRRLLFAAGYDPRPISTPYAFHSAYMAPIIEDASPDLSFVAALLATEFGVRSSLADRRAVRALCRIVADRAARLAGALLAALVLKASGHARRDVAVCLTGALLETNEHIRDMAVSTMHALLAQKRAATASVHFQPRADDLIGAAVTAAQAS